MRAIDIIGDPCQCAECHQAGVTELPRRRDPFTGELLHAYKLKAWYEARDKFYQLAATIGPKGMS